MNNTKLYAVAGNPILHSASPALHNAGFQALGIDAVYTRLSAQTAEEALESALQMGLSGMSITSPFKEDFIHIADKLDSAAKATGAVNTLLISKNGSTKGFNTDIDGVKGALIAKGVRIRGTNAVVLGAGGAARAASRALISSGANLTIANRTIEKAEALAEEFGCSSCSLGAQELSPIFSSAGIVVSTLSTSKRVLPGKLLKKGTVALDAIYSSRTAFSIDAKKAGCTLISGKEWLLHQGFSAFRLFTGKPAPQKEMRRALERSGSRGRQKTNIALIGFMGSGKSTVAQAIGSMSRMRVVDTDSLVEKKAGMKISEIFETRGQAHFRLLEAAAVNAACKKTGSILSLGGGALQNPKSARLVKQNCTTILLLASADEALLRLKGDSSRPLLNRRDRLQAARKLLQARLPLYAACADMAISTEGKTQKKVAELILDEINRCKAKALSSRVDNG